MPTWVSSEENRKKERKKEKRETPKKETEWRGRALGSGGGGTAGGGGQTAGRERSGRATLQPLEESEREEAGNPNSPEGSDKATRAGDPEDGA